MTTRSAKLTFHIPYTDSLKEKRQVCRSLIDKTRRRFNVSIAEIDTQDRRRTLTLGVAVVSGSPAFAEKSLDEIIRFLEETAEAELTQIEIFR